MGLISRVSSRTYRETDSKMSTAAIRSPLSEIKDLWTKFEITQRLCDDSLYQDIIEIQETQEGIQLEKENALQKLYREQAARKQKKPVTMPVPFKFDERPHIRKYSRVSAELDARKRQKQREEAKVKIRAVEIPKTTYKPFKLKKSKAASTTQLLPEFSFIARDIERAKCMDEWVESERAPQIELVQQMCNFRAKPAPKITDAVNERRKEEKMYRKIKHYVRVDTMIKTSKLPFTSDHAK